MIKPIITDLAFLRQKCKLVEKDEDISQLIKDLEDTLATLKGFGLASCQIGINKQVAIVRVGDIKIDLINPIVISKEEKVLFKHEGCLSFPGIPMDTDRYNQIVIEMGFESDRKRYYTTGIEAIVLQHEIDHLMGLTIFNRKHKGRK